MFGRNNTMGIGLEVWLDDKFSKAAETLARNLIGSGHAVDEFAAKFNNLENVGNLIKNVGDTVTAGVVASVKTFAKYEDVMNSVRVIAQETDQIKFNKLKKQTLDLATEFGVLPESIGNAQLELAKAGKKNQEILNMTRAIMALGAATGTAVDGVNGTSEILVNVMQAFGAASEEADYFAAAITSAANQSTIDVKDFFQTFRYAGDVAKNLGVSMHEVSAIIATLGNTGIKGSIAGTSYANMLRYLTTSLGQFGNKRQKEALKLLGATPQDFIDAEGRLKSMGEILEIFRKKTEHLSQTQAFDVLGGIFGVRGNRAATPLLQGIVEGKLDVTAYEHMYDLVGKDIENQVHIQQAQDMLDDTMGDWQKFQSNWQIFMIKVGEIFQPIARKWLNNLTKALKGTLELLDNPHIKKLIAFVGSTGVVMSLGGRIVLGIVSLGRFLLTFERNFSWAMKTYSSTTGMIRAQFTAPAKLFIQAANRMLVAAQKSLLASKGMMLRNTAAGPLVYTRGARGRFSGATRANTFSRWLGGLFGAKGMRAGMRFSGWLGRIGAGLARMAPWIPKVGGFLMRFGGVLGKLALRIFGWWGLVADLIVTAVTGRSLFEWLWEGLKHFGTLLGGLLTALEWIIKGFDWLFTAIVRLIRGLGKVIWGAINFDGDMIDRGFEDWRTAFMADGTIPGGGSKPEHADQLLPQGRIDKNATIQKVDKPVVDTVQPWGFIDGKLVAPDNYDPIKERQEAIKKTTGSTNTKVIEKKPIQINLNVAPSDTGYSETFNFDDDSDLMGAGIYE